MFRNSFCAVALAAVAVNASAQDADISKLREALRQLQQQVQQLEKRLQEAESKAAPAQPVPPGAPRGFNPDISVILQGTVARSSQDPNTYQISGFAPSGGEVSPAPRGFGLGESELIITSNADPYFRGQLVAALTAEDEVEVEEAFLQTLALGTGLHAEGRTLPLGDRLSERDPPARLGFPGRAARVQGVPRRAAERRRRAAALGGAYRSIRRTRRRARTRTQLPRDRQQQERRQCLERVRPSWAATSA